GFMFTLFLEDREGNALDRPDIIVHDPNVMRSIEEGLRDSSLREYKPKDEPQVEDPVNEDSPVSETKKSPEQYSKATSPGEESDDLPLAQLQNKSRRETQNETNSGGGITTTNTDLINLSDDSDDDIPALGAKYELKKLRIGERVRTERKVQNETVEQKADAQRL